MGPQRLEKENLGTSKSKNVKVARNYYLKIGI